MDNEEYRLEAVKRFSQLDDIIIKELNDLVKLTARICNTPVALVTLLDKEMQWFKATIGTDLTCTNREIAFCNYTIIQDELLIVPDATADERFVNNPMVLNDPNIKFYAGSKLTTNDGFPIGSLCVIDFKPGNLDEYQQNALQVLSKQVINLMELHWSLKSQKEHHEKTKEQKLYIETSEMKLKAIFESSRDTHILVGRDFKILAFNKSASVFIRATYKKKICYGDSIMKYTDARLLKQFVKYFSLALTGKPVKRVWLLMPGTEYECWTETSFIPVRNNDGIVTGVALNTTDITTRKRQEKLISVQNEALTRIAIIQSHELRRPVASLLGIIDLMKMEQVDFGYFNMLEVTVNELDKKIRAIVKDSEDTIGGGGKLSIVA